MAKPIKIFFVTDLHGSNVCYRKFLNALKVYNVDVGILLGDLTGKMLIPLIDKPGGGWMTTFMGQQTEVTTQEELDKLKKTIEMVGYYWVHLSHDEFDSYKADKQKLDTLFNQLMLQRMKQWITLADERLAGSPYKVYMAAGNDDQHVGPQGLELPLHRQAGRLADRHQQDDGRHADDDPQNGQGGAHLVLGQRPQGHAQDEQEIHGCAAVEGIVAINSPRTFADWPPLVALRGDRRRRPR